MYLVFLSESGQTGLSADDPSQPHHVHAGLLVQESQYISMTGEYDALVRRHFGAPAGSDGVPNELRPGDLYQGHWLLPLVAAGPARRAHPGLPEHPDPPRDPTAGVVH